MSDSQIAKIIIALNNLSSARIILNDAVTEGGNMAPLITALMDKIKSCEDELNSLQSKG